MSKPSTGLRRQLIGRMFWATLPLFLLLWVIASLASHYFINEAFDRSLARRTYALADRIEVVRGQVRVDIPVAAREMLAYDREDLLFHRVLDPQGRVLEGESRMPPLPGRKGVEAGQLVVYDGVKDGEPVRVAAYALSLKGTSARGTVLVQVGETLTRRSALATRATWAIVVPMLLVTLTAAAAIAHGIGRGLQPINRLRDQLSARQAFDLSPVPLGDAPAELRPFLNEINSLLGRLAEAVDAQSRFVADAAHQLRTPIAGIRAQAEAALASGRPDDARHALGRITHSAQTLGHLVQKLLVLARVDAAENTLQLAELDAVELVREFAREWAPRALDQGAEISLDAVDSARIQGDAQLLREMLCNLADNAARYGATRIGLSVVLAGSRVMWCVADNGPGIPEHQRQVVFAPFHRLASGVDGAGLGLTIVQRIAQLHGAEVRLETGDKGTGLRACVAFPAAGGAQ